MNAVRPAAVAGTFYPNDAEALRTEVQGFLQAARRAHPTSLPPPVSAPAPKAIIAPHAGYRYSGALAAEAYARLTAAAGRIQRVILLGPCHRVAVRGLALSGATRFATPLGEIEIDAEAEAAIKGLDGVGVFPPTHANEHALEVHLPFLQEVLGDFKLVPIVVGEAPPALVARVLDRLWGGPETLIVVSSDLSHFLNYDEAQKIDRRTADAIVGLDPSKIERDGACGRFPVGGLLQIAKARGLRVETVGLCNSGDTAGSKERVVGYGAWAFYESDGDAGTGDDFAAATKRLLAAHGPHLLAIADTSIRHGLDHGTPRDINLAAEPADLRADGAAFVTLKTAGGALRGCIGSAMAHRPLCIDVAVNAFRAAFKDLRFQPVTAAEYPALRRSISVLSAQQPMSVHSEADLIAQLRPGIDGLVIADGAMRALFLPAVWSQLPDPIQFLAHLKHKAGMAPDHWSANFRAARFIAEEIHAPPATPPVD